MYVRKYPRDRENSVRPIIDYFSLSFITHSDADSLTKASLSLTVTFSTELSGRLALHANLISPSAVLCVSLNARTCNFTLTHRCARVNILTKKTHFVLLAAVCRSFAPIRFSVTLPADRLRTVVCSPAAVAYVTRSTPARPFVCERVTARQVYCP